MFRDARLNKNLGGVCGMDATTVVDLADGQVVVVREAMGDISATGL